MTRSEDELEYPLPLSALQHWAYCPRQCGLIHLEQSFDDNLHTLRGQAVHRLVDQPGMELRKGLRIERALPVWNDALGLVGKADVVEFEPDGTPYPVEYKHGSRHKAADIAAADDLQLAAQALCLESMTGHAVPAGALFYASSKRRREVAIDESLRHAVSVTAAAIRAMLTSGKLPPPTSDQRRCHGCSLRDRCQPEAWRNLQDSRAASSLFDVDDNDLPS
ncbi:CRISPR-associated protein Cas4 [Rubrivivax benzoatilyticus]|uniref:CRISPR-associated exonuclease Cas4 n=1 Tax=Rubrivivax benzoatilyticus TaxID=316997 RepID=A0ABX0HU50_9BURK|nr:CRISPR-associated protein Cas4 [Rubrivivax benzoatilyticus]EGJ10199.1 CRISPR-associated Cas4 family protein [Rubrivivax benzoatilyticus JA2 = ATCC BAA-35]NHK96924.1 CRISPR-associated protein Cas4 [Rubrivivax benzoatilyticus]NHL24639.1 CRISPR-associated protein Cas4 [Rubrivivax benzoatilyticus]